jgi:hypothetical protein
LERGFRAFKVTGSYIPPSRFTKKEWNTTLSDYMKNTTRLDREDWIPIMEAAKSKKSVQTAADNDPDTSILQQYRGQIFVPRRKTTAE